MLNVGDFFERGIPHSSIVTELAQAIQAPGQQSSIQNSKGEIVRQRCTGKATTCCHQCHASGTPERWNYRITQSRYDVTWLPTRSGNDLQGF